MTSDQLTQKFKLKGEISPKKNPSERWRILDAYNTSCYIKEVNGIGFMVIDYDELDRDWSPYKKPKSKPVVIESAKDKFGNELRVGDEVYYATSYCCGRGYAIEKGRITGFTPCTVIVSENGSDSHYIASDKIGKI
jgi:hypothetical protein